MKIFLYDPEWDYELEDYDASLEEAIEAFYDLPDMERAFFGLFDAHRRFVQFAWKAQDKWLIDLPSESFETTGESYQIYGSYNNCIEIIEAIFNEVSVNDLQIQLANKTFFKNNIES